MGAVPPCGLALSAPGSRLAPRDVVVALKTGAFHTGQPQIEPTLLGAQPKERGSLPLLGENPKLGSRLPISRRRLQRRLRANVTGASGAALET